MVSSIRRGWPVGLVGLVELAGLVGLVGDCSATRGGGSLRGSERCLSCCLVPTATHTFSPTSTSASTSAPASASAAAAVAAVRIFVEHDVNVLLVKLLAERFGDGNHGVGSALHGLGGALEVGIGLLSVGAGRQRRGPASFAEGHCFFYYGRDEKKKTTRKPTTRIFALFLSCLLLWRIKQSMAPGKNAEP